MYGETLKFTILVCDTREFCKNNEWNRILFCRKRILFWKFWLKEDTVLKIWVERGYYFEKISLYPDIDAKLTNQNTGIDYVIMTQDYVINKHDKPDKQIPRSTAFYDKILFYYNEYLEVEVVS